MRSFVFVIIAFATGCGANVDMGPGTGNGALGNLASGGGGPMAVDPSTPVVQPGSGGSGPTLGPSAPGGASSCRGPIPPTREAYRAPSTCAAIETEIVGFAESEAELRDLILGQWLVCGGPSVFGTSDDVGLELAADGQWFKLYPDGGGGLARGQGFDRQGTFSVFDHGDHVQLDMLIAGSGTMIMVPQFSAVPRKVRLDEFGVDQADYVFDGDAGLCGGAGEPPDGPYAPPIECNIATTPQSIVDVETARAALTGKWALCATPSVFGSEEAGLEFTADGRFFKLYADSAGAFVRGAGFDREGTYMLLDHGDYIQLDMQMAGSGTFITLPAFGSNPRVIRLNNNGVYEGNYVFVEP